MMPNRADELPIADASFPAPFPAGLEFNAPVHGTWNIVHIGMQIPEAIQIYVCAKNCMRGVVLTAAEMNASDRFSYVILSEKDMVSGDIETITIEGVKDVIRKRKCMPRAVILFTVCVHHFLGCDYNRIYRDLEKEFPNIDFIRSYMDPIMQKKGLTPDQKLRRATYEKLQDCPVNPQKLALLGSDFLIENDNELCRLIEGSGKNVVQIRSCSTYNEFLSLAEAEAFLCIYPPAKVGVSQAAERLNRPFFYMPACFDFSIIDAQIRQMADFLGLEMPDLSVAKQRARKALHEAKQVIKDVPIVIDYTVHPRPLGLAKLLIEHGFTVKKVYLDAVNREEEADFLWLQAHVPNLILSATIHVNKRIVKRECDIITLAIGQKAAWFEGTDRFVNIVSGGNLFGYAGIEKMARLMIEAYEVPKDTRDLVPRKGWGCESCL